MRAWMMGLAALAAGCSGSGELDAGAGMDAGATDAGSRDAAMDGAAADGGSDAGPDAGDADMPAMDASDDAGMDSGPGVFLAPGYACPPELVIAAIHDAGAPDGDYTIRAAGEAGPSATLRRDGAPVATIAYDADTTIGPIGSGREYTFSFPGYFDVVIASASAATGTLFGLQACLFDGTKLLRGETQRPDAGPTFDAGPFHDGGLDAGPTHDGGCVLDDIYEEDDVASDATPLPFGLTLGNTACADSARAPDADWHAPMTHTDARFLEVLGLGGEYTVSMYDAALGIRGFERGTPPLHITIGTDIHYLEVRREAVFACSCADYSLELATTILW